MKQSFIKIGEGLTDLFEFTTLIEYNHKRINRIVYFHTPHSEKQLSSVAIIMNLLLKTFPGYVYHDKCLKISLSRGQQKFNMINSAAENYDIPVVGIDVQPPDVYPDLELYFNYLISKFCVFKDGYHLCNKLILYCISCFSFSYVFSNIYMGNLECRTYLSCISL